jgi:transcriptional regulator with XRE-family HTH domain
MTLGERIKYLRKEKGITQEELAKQIGAIRGTLANWEVDAATPDKDTLVKIADFFHVSTDYLLGRSKTPWPTQAAERIKEGALPYNVAVIEAKPGEYNIDLGNFMTKADIAFYRKYKQLTPEQQKILDMMADQMLGKNVSGKGE